MCLCGACFNGVMSVAYKVGAGYLCVWICVNVCVVCADIVHMCFYICNEWCVLILCAKPVCIYDGCVMYVYADVYMAWHVWYMCVHI